MALITGSTLWSSYQKSRLIRLYIVRRGNSDKKEVLSRIQNELRINKFETPFLIDDVNDFIVLSWVGLFIAAFIAILVVKKVRLF